MIFNHIVKLRLFGAVLLMVSVIFAASAACLAQQIYTDGSTVYQNGMPIGMICGYCGGRGSVTCNNTLIML